MALILRWPSHINFCFQLSLSSTNPLLFLPPSNQQNLPANNLPAPSFNSRWLSCLPLRTTRATSTTKLSCYDEKSCQLMRSAGSGRRCELIERWEEIERHDGRNWKIGGSEFGGNLMDWSAREPLWKREMERAVVVTWWRRGWITAEERWSQKL